MREPLIALSRKIARVIRLALESRAITDDLAPKLAELLPPARVWALSVILASWELSKAPQNRAGLSKLLESAGVPSLWHQLDLMAERLDPFVQAARDAQSEAEQAEAALRFLDAAHELGLPLLRQVVQSKPFLTATRTLARDLPEPEAAKPAAPADWRPGSPSAEREEIATGYLLFLGYSRADVERYLSGKR